MKEIFVVFFFLGFVNGFRLLRTPLTSQRWNGNSFVGQRSISRDSRISYAMDDRIGINTTRRSWIPRELAEMNGETKDKQLFLFDRDNDNPTQEEVDAYFLSEPNPSPDETVKILERTVKWKKNHKIDVLTGEKLHFVMSSLQSILFTLNREQLHNATVRTLMCLQVVPLADVERSGMLRVGLELLNLSRQRNIRFTAIGVARMLYGLMKMSSYSPEVRDLLSVLIDVVNNSQEKLGAQAISTSLYGLKGMSSEHDEVRLLLCVLTDKIKNNEEKLNAQDISMALYGLQTMSSEHDEVRSLLSVLTDKLKGCPKKLRAQEVCMALYGLRLMSSDHAEVRSLLVVLTEKAKECQQEFGPQRVAMSLYGLQSMSSEYPEVRKLLVVLTGKMSDSQKVFNATSVIMSLHGLQRMSSKHSAVRDLLAVLADKIAECPELLTAQKHRKAMFWLQDMSMEHSEARKLLIALAGKKGDDSPTDVSSAMDYPYVYGFVHDQ